jgi:ankyrin repeat protein
MFGASAGISVMKTIVPFVLIGCLVCLCRLSAGPLSTGGALFEAIRAGDRVAVQEFLKGTVDLQARNDIGDTPLMAAALYGDGAIVEMLIKAGSDVNAVNPARATALMRAATFQDKTRLLVAAGANVNARSRMGNTPLILAARRAGNSQTVTFLLDRGADANAANVFGATALMAATAAEDIDSVRLLLDHGADVNAKPKMDGNGFIWGGGRTPLMWAAFLGNESLVELLLQRGAKVNDFTVIGSALGQAAWGGHATIARSLIDAGAEVDQRDLIANYTPLHWAASSERSSPAVVGLLLARGANPNAEGGQPVDNFLGVARTPLLLARKRGGTPIAQALLGAGAADAAPARTEKATQQLSATSRDRTANEAIQRALSPLTKTAEQSVSTFLRHASKQDCVSCHQQQVPLLALSLAHSRHFTTDRQATRHQIELLKRSFLIGHITQRNEHHNILEVNLQTTFHPEPAISAGYAAMNLRMEDEPASGVTDSLIHQLATLQHADGHWSWNLPRPPIQASDITATAQAVVALQSYGMPARQMELALRVQRAREWLAKVPAETNEERAHQLLGLAWSGAKPGELESLIEELLRQQRPKGGWAQLAGLDCDAYASGQALYALMEGGKVSASHPAIRRGLEFLIHTQLADGTWYVQTRAHPFQPPMDSGFPHGRDGWISAAATGWGVMALAISLDPSHTPATLALAKAATIAPAVTAAAAGATAAPVEFVRDIQPLLERSCVTCHSGKRPKGGFKITDRNALLRGGARGEPAIVPGKPDDSLLIRLVRDQVEDLEMPPLEKRENFPALTKDEIEKLSAWIAQGANWPADAIIEIPGQ